MLLHYIRCLCVVASLSRICGYPLENGWYIRHVALAPNGGEWLSGHDHIFDPSEDNWIPAVVPGTVLSNLVRNDVFDDIPGQDPYFDRSLENIPDISEVGREYYTYFYFNKFDIEIPSNGRTWLNFRGINYRVEVYFNGVSIVPIERDVVEGMFIRYTFDISDLVMSNNNKLTVLAHPPDNPGAPGGQGGDQEIGKNAASMQFSAGWDWIQATPDRNTGLWDKVFITHTYGDVLMRHPHIVTDVDTVNNVALLKISTFLHNASPDPVLGNVSYSVTDFTGSPLFGSFEVEVPPGPGDTLVKFDTTSMVNPKLWMPIGYGEPNLYTLKIEFCALGHSKCNSDLIRFGVRSFRTDIDEHTNGRIFFVNDQLVFIRGSNWITTDQFLRFSADTERYYNEVKMHAEMGMNLIRIWGGGIAERPEFFDACDEFGIMVLQDFWMTGDVNGRWAGSYDWPLDHNLYNDAVRDTIYMLRNHASLLFYAGGNELNDPNHSPPPDIQGFITEMLTDEDGDPTRFYIQSTMNSYGNEYALARADGPYGIQNPKRFYSQLPGYGVAFNPEIGNIGMTVVESLQRTLSEEALQSFPQETDDTVHSSWDFHTYIKYTDDEGVNHIYNYGAPVNVSEYAFRAQLVNYAQYRALFEGHMSRMYDLYTGVLIWKSHNPWTGLRGNLYDWFLDQTGAFFGIKSALESIHVQFDLRTHTTDVINILHKSLSDLFIRTYIFNFDGEKLLEMESTLFDVESHSHYVGDVVEWPQNVQEDEVIFLRLELFSHNDVLISKNDYWLSDWRAGRQNLLFLRQYRDQYAAVEVDSEVNVQIIECDWVLLVQLHNPGSRIAFAIRLRLLKNENDETLERRILPAWYSDNYFSLLPGEKRVIEITAKVFDGGDVVPEVWLEGWNVRDKQVDRRVRANVMLSV